MVKAIRCGIAAMVAAASTLGCDQVERQPKFTVEISSKFSASQTQDIIDSLYAWHKKTGDVLDYYVVIVDGPVHDYEGQHNFVSVEPKDVPFDRDAPGKDRDATVGFTDRVGEQNSAAIGMPIYTRPGTLDKFKHIITHELGHAFGIDDHYYGTKTAVMANGTKDVRHSDELTCEDAKMFCAVWGCDTSACTDPVNIPSQ